MVPPGDGLLFWEAKQFQKLNADRPELVQAVKDAYAAHPEKFHRVEGDLYKGDFNFRGEKYESLILRRGGARVYLLALAEIIKGQGIQEDDLDFFKRHLSK